MLHIIGWLLLVLFLSGLLAFIEDSFKYFSKYERRKRKEGKSIPMTEKEYRALLRGTLTKSQWNRRISNNDTQGDLQ